MSNFLTLVFRLFPLVVAICVLAFPAYKGVGLGYVPLTLGAILVWRVVALLRTGVKWAPGVATLYLLPALIQLGLIVVFRPEPQFDGVFVYRHALEFLNSGRMDPMTYYPPAMTWWYAGWFWLFGASILVAQLSHIPLSLGVTWATLQLGREVTGSDSSSRWAALAVAWYPTFLGYVLTTPYYHYLYTLLTVIMTWMAYRFWKLDHGRGAVLLAGLCAGVGALTKAVQLIAPFQLVAWLGIMACAAGSRGVPLRKWMLGTVLFGAGMLMAVVPWAVRNWLIFDDLVPVCTSGGLVLYSANNPDSNGLYSGTPDRVTVETPSGMLAYSRRCSQQAKTFMKNTPEQFVNLAWRKFLHTWGSEATFVELINWRGQPADWIKKGFSFIFLMGWAALVFAWASLALKNLRERVKLSPYEWLTGVMVLSNAFVYVVFEGGDRHHLALVPLIVVLIAEKWHRAIAGAQRTP